MLNFGLSLRRLLKITGEIIPFSVPALGCSAAIAAVWGAGQIRGIPGPCGVFLCLLGSLLCLMQVVGKEDFLWLQGLIQRKKTA